MLDKLPSEVLADIFANTKRHDLDKLQTMMRRFYEFVNQRSEELPARQIHMFFKDPLAGFSAWEIGVYRHSIECELYKLYQVLRGCVVRKVSIANVEALDEYSADGFMWFGSIINKYKYWFKVCKSWSVSCRPSFMTNVLGSESTNSPQGRFWSSVGERH